MKHKNYCILLVFLVSCMPLHSKDYKALFTKIYSTILNNHTEFITTAKNNLIQKIQLTRQALSNIKGKKFEFLNRLRKFEQVPARNHIPSLVAAVAAPLLPKVMPKDFVQDVQFDPYTKYDAQYNKPKIPMVPEKHFDPKKEIEQFKKLLVEDPTFRSKFIELVDQDFSNLCTNYDHKCYFGHHALLVFLDNNANEIKRLSPSIINEAHNLIKSHHGYKILKKVIKRYNNPNSTKNNFITKQLSEKIEENFEKVIIYDEGIWIIEKLIQENPALKKNYAMILAKKIDLLFEDKEYHATRSRFLNFLKTIVKSSPEAQTVLTSYLQNNIKKINSILFNIELDTAVLLKNFRLLRFLLSLNEKNSDYCLNFLLTNLKNGTLAYDEISFNFLDKISKNHPQITTALIQKCTEDLNIICMAANSYQTLHFIESALKSNHLDLASKQNLLKKVAEQFITLALSNGGPLIITTAMKTEGGEIIIESFKENIIKLGLYSEYCARYLIELLQKNDPLMQTFIEDLFINSLSVSCDSLPTIEIVIKLLATKHRHDQILTTIANNFVDITNTNYGYVLLASAFKDNPDYIFQLIESNIEHLIKNPHNLGSLVTAMKRHFNLTFHLTEEIKALLLDNVPLLCQSRPMVTYLKQTIKTDIYSENPSQKKLPIILLK